MLWLQLQELLIAHITRFERKIREDKSKIKSIKYDLGNPDNKINKSQASELKSYIEYLKFRNETKYRMLFIYKSMGDAIAFTFIDRHDIKPQGEKESAGFISNKKGNRLEKRCLRYAFQAGGIAILNDLTNYLRHCDLTIINGYNEWIPLEIKSGRSSANNHRAQRQMESSNELFNYIFNGGNMKVPGLDFKRVSQTSKTIDHRRKFNDLIVIAKREGFCIKQVEEGLAYLVAYDRFPPENLIFDLKFSSPITFLLNNHKETETLLAPLLMNFEKPEYYIDFLRGELVVAQVLDFDVIRKHAKKKGYSVNPLEDKNFPFEFVPNNENLQRFNITNFALSKIFFEFLSPKWWVSESINSLNRSEFIDGISGNA